MPAADVAAERPDVEDDLIRLGAPAAAHHRVATLREKPGGALRRWSGFETVEDLRPFGAQEPQHFGRQASARPRIVAASPEGGSGREDSAPISRLSRLERQQPASV